MKKAAKAAPAVEPARKAMKISQRAIHAAAPAYDALPIWTIPQPAPGVLPEGVAGMAADDQLTGLASYAQQSPYLAGYGTYGAPGQLGFLGYPFLAALAQQPEYRRGAETLAREMTRKWIKLHATGDDSKEKADKLKQLDDAMDGYGVQDKFRRIAELDGYFGRGQLFLDTGTDARDLPLVDDPRTVKKGGLKALKVVEPVWTYPVDYDSQDPLSQDFYRPKAWWVMGKKVHASRLLTIVGREVPDLLKPVYMFGGVSLNQMAMPYVNNWTRTQRAVGQLLHSFSTMNLATSMADAMNGGTGGDIAARAQLYSSYRDNSGLMLTDKETEELKCVAVPLGTLDHLQAQAQEQMASVFGIPLVILLGITPSGLNASAEGDIRIFYDFIRSYQEHLFRKPLRRVLDIIQLSEFGEIDPEITFSFNSLWEMSDKEKAELRKADADTFVELIAAGVVSNEEVREVYANAEESAFAGLDLSGPPPEPEPLAVEGAEGGEPGEETD